MTIWVPKQAVIAIHDDQIAEHGGLPGIRDEGALESALARAPHLQAYQTPTLPELAAAYGFGIAKDHPFNDGNKRTSLTVIATFLLINGYRLIATEPSAVATMYAIASNAMSESELATWVRLNVRPKD